MSTLVTSNISDGSTSVGTSYVVNGSAKAWVSFDGDPVGIYDSLNMSSVTDNGTGDYRVTYTTSFANTNYATTLGIQGFIRHISSDVPLASYIDLNVFNNADSRSDTTYIYSSSMGELA